jgi:DNA-binding MarR family transcriptional regulator
MATAQTKDPLEDLYQRPGFLIRRAQQIAVSIFLEETGALRITNTQYGILFLLKQRQGLDQISVAKLLGLDRSTTGMVLGKLEQAGLIGRCVGAHDRRTRTLALTPSGETLLAQLAEPARRAQTRVLAAFSAQDQEVFLELLAKLVGKFNDSTRVPLEVHRSNGKRQSIRRIADGARGRA